MIYNRSTYIEPVTLSNRIMAQKKQVKRYKVIRIHAETHAKLTKLGIKEETFDSIVRRLIDEYEQKK